MIDSINKLSTAVKMGCDIRFDKTLVPNAVMQGMPLGVAQEWLDCSFVCIRVRPLV